jgi:prepilin peptidase CpaA
MAIPAANMFVCVICFAACIFDMRTRRIPNALTLCAAVCGVAFHFAAGGLAAAGWSLAGWGLGALLFFPWFALGGMGAGDVKLLAALGAWLGPDSVLWVALYAAIAGGGLALLLAVAHGYLGTAFANLHGLLGYWRVVGFRPMPDLTLGQAGGPRLPYAISITAGALVALWL